MEESYQIIARKYRPQTFQDVVGQEAIVTTLKNSIRLKRLAHAYLFCGCRGTGKTTLARLFAKALMCPNLSEEIEPCDTCKSCREIATSRSLDVMEIDGASHRGIDDIRQINETVLFAPSTGSYKIYIIDEVHMLTKEAFNALLKTLEEPPEKVMFFFATTEPHKVLSTILSRSIRFDLARIPHDKIIEKLTHIARDVSREVSFDAIELIAQFSDGSLRDAESLLDQVLCFDEGAINSQAVSEILGLLPRDLFFDLDQAVAKKDLTAPFVFVEKIYQSGKDLHFFLEGLIEHYRLLLQLKLWPEKEFPLKSLKETYEKSTEIYSQSQCIFILDFLLKSSFEFQKTSLKKIHLEMILFEIIQSGDKVSLPELVNRLTQLQNSVQGSQKAESPNSTRERSSKPTPVIKSAPQPVTPKPTPIAQPVAPKPTPAVEPIPQSATPKPTPIAQPVAPVPKIKPEASTIEDPTPRVEEFIAEKPIPKEPKKQTVDAPFSYEGPIENTKPNPLDAIEKAMQRPAPEIPKASQPELLTPPKAPAAEKPKVPEPSVPQNTPPAQPTVPPQREKEEQDQKTKPPSKPQSHYDTLMRFAAVELEGIVKTR